jgi:hypothetical protein
MNNSFNILDDTYVILYKKGVYKQAKVFVRNNLLYAEYGSGYILLCRTGTSIPTVAIKGFCFGFNPDTNNLGQYIHQKVKGFVAT